VSRKKKKVLFFSSGEKRKRGKGESAFRAPLPGRLRKNGGRSAQEEKEREKKSVLAVGLLKRIAASKHRRRAGRLEKKGGAHVNAAGFGKRKKKKSLRAFDSNRH